MLLGLPKNEFPGRTENLYLLPDHALRRCIADLNWRISSRDLVKRLLSYLKKDYNSGRLREAQPQNLDNSITKNRLQSETKVCTHSLSEKRNNLCVSLIYPWFVQVIIAIRFHDIHLVSTHRGWGTGFDRQYTAPSSFGTMSGFIVES